MALSIKHPEADRLARELAAHTGESLTEAVVQSLRERLLREPGRVHPSRLRDERGRFARGVANCRSWMIEVRTNSSVTTTTGFLTDSGGYLRASRDLVR